MNPVLLKPGSGLRSRLVVFGKSAGEADATGYWGAREGQARLRSVVLEAYDGLRSRGRAGKRLSRTRFDETNAPFDGG